MTQPTAKLNAFPVFVRVEGRVVVIVGGGDEALAKARLLGQSSATIKVVASEPQPELPRGSPTAARRIRPPTTTRASSPVPCWCSRRAATRRSTAASPTMRAQLGIPVNAVDRPELCDFFTPAIVNRAPVCVAIGTEGAGPVLAQIDPRQDRPAAVAVARARSPRSPHRLRDAAERLLPKGAPRRPLLERFLRRRAGARHGGRPCRRGAAGGGGAAASPQRAATGHVALVGAGPGAEDLLTLRAQRLLMEADVIVHDALVPEAVVAMGRRDAERLPVGKRKGCHSKSQAEINALLVTLGPRGQARRAAEVGRSAGLRPRRRGDAGAARRRHRLRGRARRHRRLRRRRRFRAAADPARRRLVAGLHHRPRPASGETLPDWARLAIAGATVAVYMGRSVAAEVAARLIEAGLSPDTAVAVVENASRADTRLLPRHARTTCRRSRRATT